MTSWYSSRRSFTGTSPGPSDAAGEGVELVARVEAGERGARRGRDPEAVHHRLRAVVAGAHGDPLVSSTVPTSCGWTPSMTNDSTPAFSRACPTSRNPEHACRARAVVLVRGDGGRARPGSCPRRAGSTARPPCPAPPARFDPASLSSEHLLDLADAAGERVELVLRVEAGERGARRGRDAGSGPSPAARSGGRCARRCPRGRARCRRRAGARRRARTRGRPPSRAPCRRAAGPAARRAAACRTRAARARARRSRRARRAPTQSIAAPSAITPATFGVPASNL